MKYKDDIEGIACFAFTNEIPTTIKEMDLMSVEEDQASIPIAYTLWSLKKEQGKNYEGTSKIYQIKRSV